MYRNNGAVAPACPGSHSGASDRELLRQWKAWGNRIDLQRRPVRMSLGASVH